MLLLREDVIVTITIVINARRRPHPSFPEVDLYSVRLYYLHSNIYYCVRIYYLHLNIIIRIRILLWHSSNYYLSLTTDARERARELCQSLFISIRLFWVPCQLLRLLSHIYTETSCGSVGQMKTRRGDRMSVLFLCRHWLLSALYLRLSVVFVVITIVVS